MNWNLELLRIQINLALFIEILRATKDDVIQEILEVSNIFLTNGCSRDEALSLLEDIECVEHMGILEEDDMAGVKEALTLISEKKSYQ